MKLLPIFKELGWTLAALYLGYGFMAVFLAGLLPAIWTAPEIAVSTLAFMLTLRWLRTPDAQIVRPRAPKRRKIRNTRRPEKAVRCRQCIWTSRQFCR